MLFLGRLANRPGIPGIVPEIVLLSRRPGNLPNVPGSLANWLRFQAPVSVYDIHTRNATALGERRQRHAVLRNQNFRLCLHIRPNYIHSASNDIHTDGPRATARARARARG